MKDIHQTLISIFQAEHAEHLEHIRSTLALMEGISEADRKSRLDDVFRWAHTLKGSARVVELPVVEGLARGLESVFSRVREGSLVLDRHVTDVIHQVLESSENCMAAFRENRVPEEPVSALQAMDRLLGVITAPVAVETPVREVRAPAATHVEMIRLPGENLDRLVRSTGQILTGSMQQKTVTAQLLKLGRQIAEIESEWSRFQTSAAIPLRRLAKAPEFSPVSHYVESVQQKVHSLASEARKVRFLQQRSAWNIQASAEQLQLDVWTARLAPVEDLFEGFRKMVRDLAREEKKEIEFRLTGTGVRADRAVLQALKDPVMHLLRNAIGHGIEPPGERESKGKPAMGSLTLRMEAARGRLMVEIDDDGRGVDLQAVADAAVEEGLFPVTR